MSLFLKAAHELQTMLRKREISAEELINQQLARIDAVEDQVKAFLTLSTDQALQKAREIDQRLTKNADFEDLIAIPIALKDNLLTAGIRTTCSAKILEDFVPPYTATAVRALEAAGGIFVGKTNMDEFAMGSSTENSAFFPTHNPWDLTRVPGGSSGGSAAAVASGEAVLALGSDTGGSIRQPAAFCGIVGLKPTYGLISRYGLVAYASSLDQIGPLTRDVTDCALMMNHLVGHDLKDSTSLPHQVEDFTKDLITDVKGLKIGIPTEYFTTGIDAEISQQIRKCIQLLVNFGAVADQVSLAHTEAALSAYYILASGEASSNLARYDGVRYGQRAHTVDDLQEMYRTTRSEGFGPEVKRRIMLGTYALSSGYYDAYYLKAQKVRTLVKTDFDQAFEQYDILISPTTPTTAFKLGENIDDPLAMYMSDICTVPINMAGIPAISIPIGFDSSGLPIGLQIMAKHFNEPTLFRVAYTLEQALRVKKRDDHQLAI